MEQRPANNNRNSQPHFSKSGLSNSKAKVQTTSDLLPPKRLPHFSRLNVRYNIVDDKNDHDRLLQALRFCLKTDDVAPTRASLDPGKAQTLTVLRDNRSSASLLQPQTAQTASVKYRKDLVREGTQSGTKRQTRDVSYLLDRAGKLQRPSLVAAPPDDPLRLPTSIEELMSERKRLEPGTPKTSEADMKAQILLKHDMFKEVPEEFYRAGSDFFADTLSVKQKNYISMVLPSISTPSPIELAEKTVVGAPSSRNDSIALMRWLNYFLEKIAAPESKFNESERFEMSQTVYYLCFKEAIRQVAVHCAERGKLLLAIWHAYFVLLESVPERYARMTEKIIRNFEQQVEASQTRFARELGEERSRRAKVELELENSKDAITNQNTELAFYRKKLAEETEAARGFRLKLEERTKELEVLREKHEISKKRVKVLRQQIYGFEDDACDDCVDKCRERIETIMKIDRGVCNGTNQPLPEAVGPGGNSHRHRHNDMFHTHSHDSAKKDTPTHKEESSKTEKQEKPKEAGDGKLEATTKPMEVSPAAIPGLKRTNTLPTRAFKELIPRKESLPSGNAVQSVALIAKAAEKNTVPPPPLVQQPTGKEKSQFAPTSAAAAAEINDAIIIQHPSDKPVIEAAEKTLPPKRPAPKTNAGKIGKTPRVARPKQTPKPAPVPIPKLAAKEISTQTEAVESRVEEEGEVKPRSKNPDLDSVLGGGTPASKSAAVPAETKGEPVIRSRGKRADPVADAGNDNEEEEEESFNIVAKPPLKTVPNIKLYANRITKPGRDRKGRKNSQATPTPIAPQMSLGTPGSNNTGRRDNTEIKDAFSTTTQERQRSARDVPVSKFVPPREEETGSNMEECKLTKRSRAYSIRVSGDSPSSTARIAETPQRVDPLAASTHSIVMTLKSENAKLKETLERERKRLDVITEKNLDLEVANTELSGKMQEIKEKIKCAENIDSTLNQMLDKLKEQGSDLGIVAQIANCMEDKKSVYLSIAQTAVDNQTKSELSFDTARELEKIPKPRSAHPEREGSSRFLNYFQFAEFKLGRKRTLRKKNNNRVIASLKSKALNEKKRITPAPLKSLLKTISRLYTERLESTNKGAGGASLSSCLYAEVTNMYGLKNVADNKFLQIIVGCIKYREIKRVQMFGRFLGVYDDYPQEALKTYLDTYEYLKSLNSGYKVESTDTDERVYVPFVKGLECAKHCFEAKLSEELWTEVKTKLEHLKVPDLSSRNPGGLIEVDQFMEFVIDQYANMSATAKINMEEVLIASDLDFCGLLTLEEFEVLFLAMETSAYSHEYALRLFSEYADIDDDNIEYLSVEKLAALAVKSNLFLRNSQAKLLGHCSPGFEVEHKFLLEFAPSLSAKVAERLKAAGVYKESGKGEMWERRLREFESRAASEKHSFRSAWITSKLLLEYSAVLLRKAEVARLFPDNLALICATSGLGATPDTGQIKVDNISAMFRTGFKKQ